MVPLILNFFSFACMVPQNMVVPPNEDLFVSRGVQVLLMVTGHSQCSHVPYSETLSNAHTQPPVTLADDLADLADANNVLTSFMWSMSALYDQVVMDPAAWSNRSLSYICLDSTGL